MRRGPRTPPPPQRRQLVSPPDRRNRRFYERLIERRETRAYELTDLWVLEQMLRTEGDDDDA